MTHHTPNEGETISAGDAKQGRRGGRVLMILILSAGATAVLLIGMWLVSQGGFSETNANTGRQEVDVQAFNEGTTAAPAGSSSDTPPPQT